MRRFQASQHASWEKLRSRAAGAHDKICFIRRLALPVLVPKRRSEFTPRVDISNTQRHHEMNGAPE